MKVDRGLIDGDFAKHFKRGSILRFYMKCDDPRRQYRYKFGIVLNKNPTEPEALLAITTTNLARYGSGYFENDILRVTPGTYGCFDEPTIIVLREIRIEPTASLKTLYGQQQLRFEGMMSSAD